jgi:SET domain-containing protein
MCLTIRFYYLNIKYNKYHDRYLQTKFIIKANDNKGRGVFANQDYKKGEVIEVCPCIKSKTDDIKGEIRNYLFKMNETESLLALGYCSMYNHSDNPSAIWEILNENQLQMKATRNIKKGDEIFTTYGEDYWKAMKPH